MPESFGASFVSAYEAAQQARRQSELDKQNKIQQAVENAYRQHSQELEQQRVKQEGEAIKSREMFEAQDLVLRRQAHDDLIRHQRNTEILADARLKLSAMIAESHGRMTAEALAQKLMLSISNRPDATSDEIRNIGNQALSEYLSAAGLHPITAENAAEVANPLPPLTLGRQGEGGILPGKETVGRFSIPPNPLARIRADKMVAETDALRALTPLKMDLLKAEQKEKATAMLHMQAETELTHLRAKQIPEEFKFKIAHDAWERSVAEGRLHNDNIRVQLEEYSKAVERNRLDMNAANNLRGYVQWINSYATGVAKANHALHTRRDSITEAMSAANTTLKDINKIPEGQQGPFAQDKLKASSILGRYPKEILDKLDAEIAKSDQELSDARTAKSDANLAGKKLVGPGGKLRDPLKDLPPIPGLRIGPLSGDGIPPKLPKSGDSITKKKPANPLGSKKKKPVVSGEGWSLTPK